MSEDANRILEGMTWARGAAIIKKDGSVVASRLPGDINAKDIAKKAISMMEASERYSEIVGGSRITHVVIGDSDGLVAVAQNRDLLLIGLFGNEFDSDSAASKIKGAAAELQRLV